MSEVTCPMCRLQLCTCISNKMSNFVIEKDPRLAQLEKLRDIPVTVPLPIEFMRRTIPMNRISICLSKHQPFITVVSSRKDDFSLYFQDLIMSERQRRIFNHFVRSK